jgi:alkylation response protein AidB-like acyl-CoA dehydrogenase
MDFDFGERESAVCQKINKVFDSESKAALAQLEDGDTDQIRGLLLKWLKRFGPTGYLALGLEKNNIALTAAQEILANISPSLFLATEVTVRIFGRLLVVYGKPDQKSEILPALKEGNVIGTVALSEGGINIENDPLNTTGISSGDGLYVSGSKGHVLNGPIADWIAVAGRMEDGVAFFLVKKRSKGLSIGQMFPMLGYNGVAVSAISLENCYVASNWVIGPFDGDEIFKTVRMWEDQILTAAGLGLMQRSLDAALNYAKSHTSGGKPIIAYQEVSFKLAEMLTLLQTAKLLAYRAAWMAEIGDREARAISFCAKVFCTESAEEISSKALQVLGGQGYFQGNPAEEGYRNAKYLQVGGTSTEISRMKIGDGMLY